MQFEVPCEMDADGVRGCREMLEKLALAPGDIVLDLARVSTLDSSGLGLLVHVRKRKLANGYQFAMRNVAPQPMQVLADLNLLGVMGYVKPDSKKRPSGTPTVAAAR